MNKLAEHHKQISKYKLCKLFGIARSNYYNNTKDKPINTKLIKLKALIRQVFKASNGSAGARTISAIVTNNMALS